MTLLQLRGVVAAPELPMNSDFSIDWETLDTYVEWLVGQKPTALAFNMDASEGPSLTREEQLLVTERVARKVAGRLPVLSGVIAGSTRDACVLAREHVARGANGIVVFPPFPTFLGSPLPAEMVYAFHAAIADAVPGIPLVAFQFPKAFGPNYDPDTLRKLASIEQIVALKEASFDTAKLIETITTLETLPRKIAVLTGSDTTILENYILGCDGALIGFAGIATDLNVQMWEAAERRDYDTAFAIWRRLRPLATFCWSPPLRDYRPRMKEALVLQGIFPRATVRPPQLGVSDADRQRIRAAMEVGGLLPARV